MSWKIVTIDDICNDITDGTHYTPTYVSKGVPFLSVKDITKGKISFDDCRYISEEEHRTLSNRCKPERGDVLYTKVGTTGIAKAIDVDNEFSIFVSVALLKLKNNMFPKFVELSLNSEFTSKQADDLTQGAANRNLVLRDLRKITLFCTSYETQRRIAAEVERQLIVAEKTKQVALEQLALAKPLNAAYLREVFVGNEWECTKLGDVGDVCMCKRVFKDQTTLKGDIPFYKIGTFGGKPDAFISRDIYDEYKSRFPFPKKGDILISAAGTLGRTVIYDGEPAYFQDSNIVWIDNDEKRALNRYLYHVYATHPWTGIDGAIIARLYNENIREAVIPLPPIDEQRRIIAYLDEHYSKAKATIAVIQAQLETINAMPAAILRQAFSEQM
jgi:type I restriction enzyme S subunit